ncbi:hypothetical protein WICPIJ_001895 [Wickerhamomyces pijperi]|uniref:Lipoprotein n=1 Tax=Wickerhamomyces pijperi TaxID=599730 RepID=A0A9P8QCW1_WICPI|nr:hypothetical protein WICPIJ_001895 [Wickerhamomyces pijperi]
MNLKLVIIVLLDVLLVGLNSCVISPEANICTLPLFVPIANKDWIGSKEDVVAVPLSPYLVISDTLKDLELRP